MSARHTRPFLLVLLGLVGLVGLMGPTGCRGDTGANGPADAAAPDSGPLPDAGPVPLADGGENCDQLAAPCVSDFGSLFTRANGRADGTLVALVRPQDTGCALVNNDHAVLELSIQGQAHRLVVAISGVAVRSLTAPLIGPPFQEGWHEGMTLDYPAHLGVSSTEFTDVTMDEAVGFLCGALSLGAPVSVYAYCDGTFPDSAHQIHRNDNYPDGAIVVAPDSASPTWLLFRYANQQF